MVGSRKGCTPWSLALAGGDRELLDNGTHRRASSLVQVCMRRRQCGLARRERCSQAGKCSR